MPTYKFSPSETSNKQILNFNQKVYYPGDTFESEIYYSEILMNDLELEFVSDSPYISPLIATTGKVSTNTELEIPDSNWGFDIHVQIPSGMTLGILFNNEGSDEKIYVCNSGIIARHVSGRSINKLIINVESGSGNFCVYCMRVEMGRYSDTFGL